MPRWIEELLAPYNAFGPQALGDLRRNNGTRPSVLEPELGRAQVFQPAYRPQMQPAEHLCPLLVEPLVNRPFETIGQLDAGVARVLHAPARSSQDRQFRQIHWWPPNPLHRADHPESIIQHLTF